MQLVGVRGQGTYDPLFDASGTIAVGGTAQLLLPRHKSRTYLSIINVSSGPLYVDFGGARAIAVMTGSSPNLTVSSFTVTNAGQGYTQAPTALILGGGGEGGNVGANLSSGQPGWPSPQHPAVGNVVMTGTVPNQTVASIGVADPGVGYLKAPFVLLVNSDYDPNGVVAAAATGGSIPLLTTGAVLTFEGSMCPTDAISIFGATTGQAFTCKFMA